MLLKKGDTGDPVADLQARLAKLGFPAPGDPAGVFAEGTESAVRQFQESRKLRVDGLAGPQTWSALIEAGYRLGDRLVYLCNPMLRGDDVADLQTRLGALGFDTGRVDGIFGPETEAALAQFQRNVGLSPDGIFGKASATELLRLGGRGGGPNLMAEVKEREALRSGSRTLSGRQITVGHGGDLDPLVHEIARRLRLAGAAAVITDDPDGSRQARQANTAESTVHLSMTLSLDLKGSLISYYAGFHYESTGGKRLAHLLQRHLSSILGGSAEVRGMSLPVLRETRMPAVICELGPPEAIIGATDRLAGIICTTLSEWAAQTWD